MAGNANVSRDLRTPKCRLSYAQLLEPAPYMENGKPKGDPMYGAELIFEASDAENFEVHIEREGEKPGYETVNLPILLVEMAKERWGEDFNVKEAVKHGGLFWPIADGNKKAEGKKRNAEAYEGKKVIRVKSKADIIPRLFVRTSGKIAELSRTDPTDVMKIKELFASGNYVVATLNAVAMSTPQGKYLTLREFSLIH